MDRTQRLNPWHVLRAVSKRGAARLDGRAIHFDQRSRVTVITDPHDAVIVTVYRAGGERRLLHDCRN